MRKIVDIAEAEDFIRKNEVIRGYDKDGKLKEGIVCDLSFQEKFALNNLDEWKSAFQVDIKNVLAEGQFVEWKKDHNGADNTIKSLCETLIQNDGYDANLVYSDLGINALKNYLKNPQLFKSDEVEEKILQTHG